MIHLGGVCANTDREISADNIEASYFTDFLQSSDEALGDDSDNQPETDMPEPDQVVNPVVIQPIYSRTTADGWSQTSPPKPDVYDVMDGWSQTSPPEPAVELVDTQTQTELTL